MPKRTQHPPEAASPLSSCCAVVRHGTRAGLDAPRALSVPKNLSASVPEILAGPDGYVGHLRPPVSPPPGARVREAQWRPCHLEAAPLRGATEWLEHYRRFWDQSLDALADPLARVQRRRPR